MATYGIVLFYPDQPATSELMLLHVLAQSIDFADGLPGSQALAKTAATAETVFTIKHGATTVGTCTFAAAGTVGIYAAAAEFTIAAGETFSIEAPASPDATLADITFTITGTPTAGTSAPRPVNLLGQCKSRTVCVGQLTQTPTLSGVISAGPLDANGRLSVTHDLSIFQNG
jgi:hypothetical protein